MRNQFKPIAKLTLQPVQPPFPNLESRVAYMVDKYGECCTKAQAARILGGISRGTPARMIGDGRLAAACGGDMVDMRSLAAYIHAPVLAKARAKQARRYPPGTPADRIYSV